MASIGYALSSEEHGPRQLVENAALAEDRGFEFALVSDHFHPWLERQGNSPFVWGVLGAIAAETESLRLGTGVTCPIRRIHPAIVAQAAATAAALLPDRFFLGVGTGENLNEHVLGDRWPPYPVRLEMLAEAVEVIRRLWSGDEVTFHGDHFAVEDARLYTLPETPPPIYVAASGTDSATAAGRFGDGLVSTAPDDEVVGAFAESRDGGTDAAEASSDAPDVDDEADAGDAPTYGQVTVCWAEDEDSAVETALEWWPNAALPGQLGQVLPTPAEFEQACELVDEDDVRERVVCGPDPQRHVDGIRAFVDAGFDHVYVHQVGPDQAGFMDAYRRDVLPAFE